MAELSETYACMPSTERGRGILISGDTKSNSILYCNGRSVIIRYLDRPLEASIYGEHAYNATVARYSPNGEWIASADVSGTVRIWGVHNEHVLKTEFRVLSGRIDDLQWSPDGLRIVASGDGKGKSFVRAFMWDSGSNVGEFDGHSKRVLSCAFKPTRPFRIVTCGEDFLVNFYEGPPFKFKLSQRGHSNFVNCIRFSPDGSKFISVSSDKKGIIYDGKTGEKVGELSSEDGHKGSIYAVTWSPDSKQVLTVSADKSAKIWDMMEDGNGKVKKTLSCPGSGGVDDMLVGCLWLNDHLITVSLGGIINLFSASDPDREPVSFSGHMKSVNALSVLLQNSQKVILSSSYDGVIVRWIQGHGFAGRLQRKDSDKIKCFTAIEEELLTSGYDNKDNNCTGGISVIRTMDLMDPVVDGDPQNSSCLKYFRPMFPMSGISQSGGLIWSCPSMQRSVGSVVLFAATWTLLVKRIPLLGDQCGDAEPIDVGMQPKDLNFALQSPELALVSTDSGVVVLRGSKVVSTINFGYAVTASAIAPDGSEAIVGGQDGKLHVYSVSGDTLTEEAVLEKHRGAINVIRYSPDASMFASGDLNREAVVWDRVSREVKLKNMLYHTARINCLAWSPDNSMVATGSLDTCVIIYEVGKPASSRITIKGAHLGGVYGLAFTDENSVVSSGEDACVRVWKIIPQ